MTLAGLAVLVLVALTAGYFIYGRFIARQYNLRADARTPAHEHHDGHDFVPTRPFFLLAQHFSAIAAAGPIVGPILACIAFGWLPCVLWILLGVVLIGAVHDFSALVASVRHGAHSIAEIARVHLGRRAWLSLSLFIWVALIYVIVAFTDVTAQTFIGKGEVDAVTGATFNPGGAVAASSVLYLLLAIVMGLLQRYAKLPLSIATIIFVPATLGAVWAGTRISEILVLPIAAWHAILLGYCLAASMLPVWALQQPRGYLGGFMLYATLAVGALGVLFGGRSIEQPMLREPVAQELSGLWAFITNHADAPAMTGMLFPFLFVTIACGACSGFHGLVCGGTTSKQIDKETHCTPIAFGAMLLEGFVAIIALATVLILLPADTAGKSPNAIFGAGIASFITQFVGPEHLKVAQTFGTLAVATFVFDTLDVSVRLGRYLIQELTGQTAAKVGRLRAGAVGFAAALATVSVPFLILRTADAGSWQAFWTLFGTSNQLLAALTLLGVTVWLKRSGKKYWFAAGPMLVVMTITLSALSLQILTGIRAALAGRWTLESGAFNPAVLNAGVAILLAGLAAIFIFDGLISGKRGERRHTSHHHPNH